MTVTRYVEKPPHADPDRIRHLSEPALVAALDLDRTDLAGVRAAESATVAVDELLAHLRKAGRRPVPALSDVVAGYGTDERERVRRQAEQAADDRRSFTDGGIGRSALYGFHYLMWTVPLLERYLLTADEHWLRRWEEIFLRWYDSRDRVHGEWPGLDVVWYTLGVGVRTPVLIHALHAGHAVLGRQTRMRLLGSVLGGARWLADEHDSFRPGNWQLVGACTLLCTGALFPEFAEADSWVAAGRARITEHLDRDVHPDGGHQERSPGYHRLCLEFLHRAALHAERYLDWPLGADDRVVAMCDWLVAMATPEGWLPPFQDTGHVAAGPSLVLGHRWAAKPEYKALATATMPVASIDSILAGLPPRDGVPAARAWAEAPAADPRTLGAWLDGSKYFVSRSGRRPGALYAAVNCGPRVGHELESHSHLACLDLVLWGHGQPLAWEAGGPDSYDDPEYHDWFQSPGAHSTVIFDGREPALDGDFPGATVDALVLRPELDLLAAYHDGWGARHRRIFLAVRPDGDLPGYWLLRDEVSATSVRRAATRNSGSGADLPTQDTSGWRWLLHGRSRWRRTGPATFVSAESPGLLLHVTGCPPASTGVGRASYPARDGPRWGELHRVELVPHGMVLSALLVPFSGAPPEVAVTEPAAGALRVDWGRGIVDEFGARGWSRGTRLAPRTTVTWPPGRPH